MHPTQHVYRGSGLHEAHVPRCEPPDPASISIPTIADAVPATWIMTSDVICAREDLGVDAVMELMVRRHIGCIPVVDSGGHPIGMVTKLDVVEHIVATRDPFGAAALTVGHMMMPLALTLDEHATVAHAAAMMAVEDVHHVPIVSDTGSLIGVVSSMDIVRWLAANDGYLITDSNRA